MPDTETLGPWLGVALAVPDGVLACDPVVVTDTDGVIVAEGVAELLNVCVNEGDVVSVGVEVPEGLWLAVPVRLPDVLPVELGVGEQPSFWAVIHTAAYDATTPYEAPPVAARDALALAKPLTGAWDVLPSPCG